MDNFDIILAGETEGECSGPETNFQETNSQSWLNSTVPDSEIQNENEMNMDLERPERPASQAQDSSSTSRKKKQPVKRAGAVSIRSSGQTMARKKYKPATNWTGGHGQLHLTVPPNDENEGGEGSQPLFNFFVPVINGNEEEVNSQSLFDVFVPVTNNMQDENEVTLLEGPVTRNDAAPSSSSKKKRTTTKRTGTISISTNPLLTKKAYKQATIGAGGLLNFSSNDEDTEGTGDQFKKCSLLKKYFKYVCDGDGQPEHFQCVVNSPDSSKICDKRLSKVKSGFYNLKKHLKVVHDIELDVSVKENENASKVTELLPRRNSYQRNHPKQAKFEEFLVDMVCVGSHKLDLLHDVTFLRVVGLLDPQINLMSRKTLVKKIHETAAVVKQKIKDDMCTLEKRCVHISCDIWSSKRRIGILGIVAHFIDDSWKLNDKLIGFRVLENAHTGANIKQKFLEVISEFGLSNEKDKIGFVTSDNASNMIAAFNLLKVNFDLHDPDFDIIEQIEKEVNKGCLPPLIDQANSEEQPNLVEYVDIDRVPKEDLDDEVMSVISESTDCSTDDCLCTIVGWSGCTAHSLQLVINNTISKHSEVEKIISYVHSVMKFFKKSTKWTDELRFLTSIDVVIPGKTRWNSTMDMLKRFLDDKFFAALRTVLEKAELCAGRIVPDIPSMTEKRDANELYELLKPLGNCLENWKTT